MPSSQIKRHPPPANQRVPDLRIGKKGITPELQEEVKRRMKSRRTLKVRVLRAAIAGNIGISELADSLAQSVDANLVEVRGHTFVMTRKSKLETRGISDPLH